LGVRSVAQPDRALDYYTIVFYTIVVEAMQVRFLPLRALPTLASEFQTEPPSSFRFRRGEADWRRNSAGVFQWRLCERYTARSTAHIAELVRAARVYRV
jgi:hypothetical protein